MSRGHGTYLKEEKLFSSVAGALDRVNKLVTVRAIRSRYAGDIGDVVIGRVLEVLGDRYQGISQVCRLGTRGGRLM